MSETENLDIVRQILNHHALLTTQVLSLICLCGCADHDYVDGIVTETRIVKNRQVGEDATYSGSEYVVDFGECKLTFHGNRKPGEEIRLLREQVRNSE